MNPKPQLSKQFAFMGKTRQTCCLTRTCGLYKKCCIKRGMKESCSRWSHICKHRSGLHEDGKFNRCSQMRILNIGAWRKNYQKTTKRYAKFGWLFTLAQAYHSSSKCVGWFWNPNLHTSESLWVLWLQLSLWWHSSIIL